MVFLNSNLCRVKTGPEMGGGKGLFKSNSSVSRVSMAVLASSFWDGQVITDEARGLEESQN